MFSCCIEAVDRDRRFQRLDRHHALERLLHGLVDHSHATAADLADDPAVPDAVQHLSRKLEMLA
jgi:hypothetical protein